MISSFAVGPDHSWRSMAEKCNSATAPPCSAKNAWKLQKQSFLLQLLSIELNFVHITMTLHHRDIEFVAISWDLDPDLSRRSTAARENDGNWRILGPHCTSYIPKPSPKTFLHPIHCSRIANVVRLCHFNAVGVFLCQSESPSKIWLSSLLIPLVAPHETLT